MKLIKKFKTFTGKEVPVSDTGIKVEEIIPLLKGNKFEKELLESLEIDNIKEEFISIPGANTALSRLMAVDRDYKKIDHETSYRSLEFDSTRKSKEEFAIVFEGVTEEDENITALPIYSARTDFFEKMNGMDKYASQLFSKGLSNIVYANLELLQKNSKATKNKSIFRLLKEYERNIFFLRAIVSTSYRNYDNKVALFVALISLHKSSKATGNKFRISNFEYSESYVRIYFESNRSEQLKNFGEVTQLIEVSNDEIKNRALNFKCLLKICYYDKNKKIEGEIIAKPQTTGKYSILRITHGQNVPTAIKMLNDISKVDSITNTVFEDAKNISEIDKPDFIRDLVKRKIDNARVDELKEHKNALIRELETKVTNMYDLLKLFNKLNL
ncbi:MAG: hypothetical protein ACXIU2_01670, partial [Cyclobacteriaceae bacterium]